MAVAITAADLSPIALRLTDRSGLTEPLSIPTPDLADSQAPDLDPQPFTDVNIYAWLDHYERFLAENVQVFAGVTTVQDLQMIPLASLPGDGLGAEVFNTPPQDL